MDFDLSSFLRCGTLFSKSQTTLLVGYGPRTWLSEPEPLSFYFPDFFLQNAKKWFVHEKMQEIQKGELFQALKIRSTAPQPTKRHWHNADEQRFYKTVEDLHYRFHKGELIKAVPYICQYSDDGLSKDQLAHILANLLDYSSKYPALLYGFWDEQSGLLGATPEILFRLNDNAQVETMACAGTRRCGPDQDLIAQDAKELYEHRLVVSDIVDSLSPYGCVSLGKQEVRPFNKLVHLVTPIYMQLKKATSFEEIVTAMHPTSALGAIPRAEGKKWLAHYADYQPRGRYGAPVGFVKGKTGACAVAIRNMQWQNNRISLYAGCGVVPDSTAEKEWCEIQLKLQSIKDLLAL